MKLRLKSIEYGARDALLFEFGSDDETVLPEASAGAHIDVRLPNGLTRQYSLTDANRSPTRYRIGVKRALGSRGGSAYLHDSIKVGDFIEVGSPRNNFKLYENATHSVLVAGGIGITPIWCMAQRLMEIGRSWELHYACRSREAAMFYRRMLSIENVQLYFGDEAGHERIDLRRVTKTAPHDSHFYCCGPEGMLDAFERATDGLPAENVHLERFNASINTEGAQAPRSFVVKLMKSGLELVVPAGKSILEVAREAGVDANSSCEVGVCGACETRVICGIPDHRDQILSPFERASNQTMMICCSGCKSGPIKLDL
ncbi:PDR/VanB family oxidoreductase [Paraburkholderia heleia]|uniref:PDR/VanB family oxidoreductase n=1 Tax=Paraburkholderia heleia TaxID=634127 RepID=UPI0031DF7BC3